MINVHKDRKGFWPDFITVCTSEPTVWRLPQNDLRGSSLFIYPTIIRGIYFCGTANIFDCILQYSLEIDRDSDPLFCLRQAVAASISEPDARRHLRRLPERTQDQLPRRRTRPESGVIRLMNPCIARASEKTVYKKRYCALPFAAGASGSGLPPASSSTFSTGTEPAEAA